MYNVFIIFLILVLLAFFIQKEEKFEQVKIKLKQNPLNLNINNSNNCSNCNSYPDIVVPVYAPWKAFWNSSAVYPYYPFYPFYYNNYYL